LDRGGWVSRGSVSARVKRYYITPRHLTPMGPRPGSVPLYTNAILYTHIPNQVLYTGPIHYITPSLHHYITASPHYHITTLNRYRITTSPHYPITPSPHHCITTWTYTPCNGDWIG